MTTPRQLYGSEGTGVEPAALAGASWSNDITVTSTPNQLLIFFMNYWTAILVLK
jgi:hypothetical protein